ncbi:MAG: hypothetical protein HOP33_05210 [Verrucomicrobia bacterium]|nr:hypothetical protein [Verrucomicrobiota bacterium]
MASLQDLIHRFEEGGSGRYLKYGLVFLLVAGLFVRFNFVGYRNLNTQEAMDAAQIARNISEGKGYTTQFIRPLSLHLVKERYMSTHGGVKEPGADIYRIKELPHPDLANPPVYPVVLATMMKVLPMRYEPDGSRPFWSVPYQRSEEATTEMPRRFWRHQPDFMISFFNQILLLVVVLIAFNIARSVFDVNVAWLSALLLICCEYLWRFATSGQSTTLLMLIFMMIAQCLVWIEREEREPHWRSSAQMWLAIALGLLVGLGMLTRYSFGWLIIPVMVYLGIFCVLRRAPILVTVFTLFVLVATPWIVRNWMVSGTPFGTSSYALIEGTPVFPEHTIQRSLNPDTSAVGLRLLSYKFFTNLRRVFQDDIPKLGGSWLPFCFLVGLMLGFRNPALKRLRYFLLGTFVLLILVQVMGRTQLSEDSPDFNSENLLVILVPLVFVFGSGLFFLLLEQMSIRLRPLRYGVIILFSIIISLPMIFALTVAKTAPVTYPPYHPPFINTVSKWMKESELMMSDTPWAVAWYGRRQAVWLTLDAKEEFYAVNDSIKPVRCLFFTPQTIDVKIVSGWVQSGPQSWPSFILEFVSRNILPPRFPLVHAPQPRGYFPSFFVLTDRERWKVEGGKTNRVDLPQTQSTETRPADGKSNTK